MRLERLLGTRWNLSVQSRTGDDRYDVEIVDGEGRQQVSCRTMRAELRGQVNRALEELQRLSSELAGQEISDFVTTSIKGVRGIEAAFIEGQHVYVVAREHRDVDWEALMGVEDALVDRFPEADITARAHQGRDVAQMFPQMRRIF